MSKDLVTMTIEIDRGVYATVRKGWIYREK